MYAKNNCLANPSGLRYDTGMSMFSQAELEQRAQGIGGSEAAAALGLSNTVTPIDLYRHKVYGEPLPMYTDEMALWLGQQLEPVCAAAFEKHTGMELENPTENIVHPDYPFMRGFIDRKVKGKREGVELKAWSEFSRSLWGPDGSDEVPMPVLCQSVHYNILTQYECWHVGVLLGTEFRSYTIFPSDDIVKMVIEGEQKFWQHVEQQTPPPAINVRDLHYLYKRARPGSTRAATPREVQLHKHLYEVKAHYKGLETQIGNLEFKLKKNLKDVARLTHPDDDNYTLVNWRDHSKRVANSSALKKHGLWDSYSDEIAVRPMLLGDPL